MEKTIQTVATILLKENEIMAGKLCSEDFKCGAYNIPNELKKIINSMKDKSNTEIIANLIFDVISALCISGTIISLAYLLSTS